MPLEKKPSTPAVPAAQFTQNFGRYKKFGRYKMEAQRQAVPASSHGTLVGYLVPPQEEEELRRLKGMRRSIDFAELTDEEFAAIDTAARMDPRHNHLDKMFGEEPKQWDRMPLPEPEPDLVISYSYQWRHDLCRCGCFLCHFSAGSDVGVGQDMAPQDVSEATGQAGDAGIWKLEAKTAKA